MPEVKKRFFVQQSRENQIRDRMSIYGPYTPTCNVLDRETVENGKYKVMASGLKYLDAYAQACRLNSIH